ncbi:MAG: hypothetical protein J5694_06870 [Erysipelotrichaceae bacterium]|nr:hypothetical protein [Erysipelotrichaceae bacterium]
MLKRIKASLHRINYRLFAALLVLGLCPTIYSTFRVFLLGQLPGEWAYSIAGQLSWISLLYEILNESIILPLYHFVGEVRDNREEFSNRIRTGMLISLASFSIISAFVVLFTKPLLEIMATDKAIINASASYIRIESIANVFSVLTQFALVALVSVNKSRYLYALTFSKLMLSLVCDTFLVSSLPVSLELGVNGIGWSNIIVNVILLLISLKLLSREGIRILASREGDFIWTGDFFRIGSISGLESLVRNVAYMVMISRMVNVVGEQGTYWVANNFIWGWLLLPITQLGELIKQEVSLDRKAVWENSPAYLVITAVICLLWVISIPCWKTFMTSVLGYGDVDRLYELVVLLLGFYVLYAFQNVFDSVFYGLGRTDLMLFESLVTNLIYYGSAFVLYLKGLWIPSLTGIALLFGFGNAFDSLVSLAAFIYLLKKEEIVKN